MSVELSFNTTGPCCPGMHYMLPPAARLPAKDLKRFVDQELYWVLHAPRQTGKTSVLMAWMKELNESDRAVACYVSVESCQGLEELEDSMPALCKSVIKYATDMGVPVPSFQETDTIYATMLSDIMGRWAALCAPKLLVALFDRTPKGRKMSWAKRLKRAQHGAVTAWWM